MKPRQVSSRFAIALALVCSNAAHADWTAINLTPAGGWDAAVYAVTPTAQYGSSRLGLSPDTPQALIWQGSSSSWTSIGGGPGTGSLIYGVSASGGVQVGYFNGHASLWQGSPESRVDLHPTGFDLSLANAATATHQFGSARASVNANFRAAKWSGTAASYEDLNPPGAQSSGIRAAHGDQQGGAATFASGWANAGLWSGTPQSFVNLHPGPTYRQSWIAGMADGQQVGGVNSAVNFQNNAAMWSGTPESFVNMNPPGYFWSELTATVGTAQVGFVFASQTSAGIWFGTPESFLNLGQYLPAGYYNSRATSIATDGSFYYVGGFAESLTTGYNDAFLWVAPIPAPSTLALLGIAGAAGLRRRRPPAETGN